MKKITKLEPSAPVIKPRKRVAAYARISMETERMSHSLSAQVSYYNEKIQKNPDWVFAGVYSDNGISGTGTAKRDGFNRMIADCDAGKIDLVLTKSISRFARNTVDLLETVRHLKEIGVEVWFERENIRSMDGDGELMLSILASFAQEESRSISDNCKWRIKKRFERGIPNGHFRIFGYRWEGDDLIIVPEEAAVVKRIFQNYLDGKSRLETEREFAAEGITTRDGCRWVDSNIATVLKNCTYTGDLLLQKEYISDPINKKRKKNRGELPQYFVADHHEAIIDRETFDYVQSEIKRRAELGPLANKSLNITCFSGKIKCEKCGQSLMRNTRINRAKNSQLGDKLISWVCGSRKRKGHTCSTREIPDRFLRKTCAEALGLDEFDEEVFTEKVDFISVPENGLLTFHYKDGTEKTLKWENTSKKDCWTAEYRARASKYRRTVRAKGKKGSSCFTCKIKCGVCGSNYTGQSYKGLRFWRCKLNSDNTSLRDDALRDLSAEVLGLDSFDDDLFEERIDSILVQGSTLTFRFKDGHEVQRDWVPPKRRSHKHTDEYKEYMSRVMKEKWTPERKAAMSEKMKMIRKERGDKWQSR